MKSQKSFSEVTRKRPFVHASVCFQLWRSLLFHVAECVHFCLTSINFFQMEEVIHGFAGLGGVFLLNSGHSPGKDGKFSLNLVRVNPSGSLWPKVSPLQLL